MGLWRNPNPSLQPCRLVPVSLLRHLWMTLSSRSCAATTQPSPRLAIISGRKEIGDVRDLDLCSSPIRLNGDWMDEWPWRIRPRRGRLKARLYAVGIDRRLQVGGQGKSGHVWRTCDLWTRIKLVTFRLMVARAFAYLPVDVAEIAVVHRAALQNLDYAEHAGGVSALRMVVASDARVGREVVTAASGVRGRGAASEVPRTFWGPKGFGWLKSGWVPKRLWWPKSIFRLQSDGLGVFFCWIGALWRTLRFDPVSSGFRIWDPGGALPSSWRFENMAKESFWFF